MIVRTFENRSDAWAFFQRAEWKLAPRIENRPMDRVIDGEGVTRELRSRDDRHGTFWYWGRL